MISLLMLRNACGILPVQEEPEGARHWRLRATGDSYHTSYTGVYTLSRAIFRTTPGGEDIAPGNIATASKSGSGLTPKQAIDGDDATCWGAGAVQEYQWWSIDFGASVSIVEIVIRPRTDFSTVNLPSQISVETSADGETWTTVAVWDTLDTKEFQTLTLS